MTAQDILCTLLENLEAFEPSIVPSPKYQPRRACVSLIIRWNSPDQCSVEDSQSATTWREFLEKPWIANDKVGDAELLFMQRSTRAGDRWSGHVAFPGGKNEKDETDVDTVVRETLEEIGLDLNSKDFIAVGRLDDREITSAQDGKLLMMLSPFVYLQVSPQTPNIKLQKSEVASIHWVPLKFFLSTEPYHFRPMKIKLMKRMPPFLKSMAPVAQELFGDMVVPAIDLPDSDPPPRLWGLTLGMTCQLIDMTEESISGRPHRSKSQKQLTFVKLDKSPPNYTYPDIAALVWLFYKAGLAWEKITGTAPKHRVRCTSWAAAPELRVYFAALRRALIVAGLLRVGGIVFMAMKLYSYLKSKRA